MNCLALSAHLIFKKDATSKCQKTNAWGNQKVFAFLNIPAQFREEIIKPDGIKYKNQTIKIEKAHTQYLSKLPEANIRPSPVVNNNPENQDLFIRNIPGNKSYAQATVPSNSARTSNKVIFRIALLTLVLN